MTMTEDQVEEVYKFTANRLNTFLRERQRRAAFNFNIGQRVQFYSSKMCRNIIGPITKINSKSVKMTETCSGIKWTVSADLLKAVV